ncbi:MAG: hypothetical protein ACRYG7_14225 [Janthinobacterium lividum]
MEVNKTILPAVGTHPNTARGEVSLTVGGSQYPVKFNMNVMRDWTKLTGRAPSEFGEVLSSDYTEALTSIITCAVRRFVPGAVYPAGFTQDDAADLLDEMGPEEATNVAEAITEAVTVVNPLLAALSKQVAAKTAALHQVTPSENGPNISASPMAS